MGSGNTATEPFKASKNCAVGFTDVSLNEGSFLFIDKTVFTLLAVSFLEAEGSDLVMKHKVPFACAARALRRFQQNLFV